MSFLTSTLRFILSPIADPHWENKINQRRMLACLTPLGFIDMPLNGRFNVGGDVLAPIEFHDDGQVRVGDHIFDHGTDFDMELENNVAICREGELLSISQDDTPRHLFTYQQGGWQKWGYKQPSWLDAVVSEFYLTRERGERILNKTIVVTLIAFFVLWVLLALLNHIQIHNS